MNQTNRTKGSKPTDPAVRAGVYSRLDDVPDRYRFYHLADAYDGRDVWAEFIAYEREEQGYDSHRYEQNAATCRRRWTEHMADRGRHRALAQPADVETFMAGLLDRMKPRTAYQTYWSRLEAFYTWLQWHTEHPHRYHPVLMAAAVPDSTAARLWAVKLGRYDRTDTDTDDRADTAADTSPDQ